jgi:hypothetical protein
MAWDTLRCEFNQRSAQGVGRSRDLLVAGLGIALVSTQVCDGLPLDEAARRLTLGLWS